MPIWMTPGTLMFMYYARGMMHHILFESFELNLAQSFVAGFGVVGDLIYITYLGGLIFCHLESAEEFLSMMQWKPGTTNQQLSSFIKGYRLFQHTFLLIDEFAHFLFPVVHICAGLLAISYLFNSIYSEIHYGVNLRLMSLAGFLIVIGFFRILSKAIVEYVEKSEAFLDSYKNMPDMSLENRRALKACLPLRFEVRYLLSYEKVTFVKVVQDVILVNVIDLILGFSTT